MSEHPIGNLMTETMAKIKEMVDVNTIIGSPITAADGTTVIPVSRVSFGFGAGGSDFASKHAQAGAPMAFGGGGGAGVTVSPVCFLIITKDGSASILGINAQADSTVDRLVEMIPGAINRVSSFVEGFSGKKKTPADESAPMEGGERAFVDKMNAKARELGLTDTRFENPSGLPSDGHYTTARELAKITAAALRDPVFRDIVSTKTCTAAGRTLVNHNRLLSLYKDAIGVKTGFTRAAGRCLVSAAERNGRTVIAVTLNDPDDWNDHIALLDDAFSRYSEVTLHEKGDALAQTQVFGGETDRAELVAESTVTAYLLPGEQDRLRRVRYGEKFCYAPVVRAAAAGTVEYRLGDAVIASDRLKYGGEVLLAQEKRGLLDRLRQRLAG